MKNIVTQKLNAIYQEMDPVKFKKLVIFFCFLGDLGFSYYLYILFSDREVFQQMFNLVQMSMPEAQGLPSHFMDELYQLMMQSLTLMIAMVISIHLLVYFLYSIGKTYALNYIKLMSALAFVSCLFLTFGNDLELITLLFVLMTLGYGFVFLGFRYFSLRERGQI